MDNLIDSLKLIGDQPLALVGYIAIVGAWLYASLLNRKAIALFRAIKSLPEEDRLKAITLEYRVVPKSGLTAEQWLRSRQTSYIFAAFALTCFVAIFIIGTAIWLASKSVSVHGASAPAPVTAGIVLGSVYVNYEQAKNNLPTNEISKANLRFVSESITYTNSKLVVRFSIYNNAGAAVRLYDIKTIEYGRQNQMRSFSNQTSDDPPRRYTLDISPENPFVEQDVLYEIPAAGSSSFKLNFFAPPDIMGTEIVFGVICYFHNPTGHKGSIKSEKLYFLIPERGKVVAYDKTTIENAIRSTTVKQAYSTMSGDGFKDEVREEIPMATKSYLEEAIIRHEKF